MWVVLGGWFQLHLATVSPQKEIRGRGRTRGGHAVSVHSALGHLPLQLLLGVLPLQFQCTLGSGNTASSLAPLGDQLFLVSSLD